MDYLDTLINLHQIEGKIKVLCRFHGAWDINHPQEESSLGVFHIISKGTCCIKLNGVCQTLKTGDVVFLPYGAEHEMMSCPTFLPNQSISEKLIFKEENNLNICTNGQEEYDFEMFCGYFRYRNVTDSPLFKLPKWHLATNNKSVIALLSLLQAEVSENIGNQSVIDALSTILFTYLVRDYLSHNQIENGILGALQDKRLKNAVQAMLDAPEKNWDMDSLATCCAMARSTFIRAFKEKTGISAGKFLTTIRLQKAEQLLKNSELSVQQIALAVGYQSEAHFSKLFKQYKQCLPSEFRAK